MVDLKERLLKFHWARAFYLLILVTGIVLYLAWGIYYDALLDIGLYSMVILMVLFGGLGYLLYTISPTGGKR